MRWSNINSPGYRLFLQPRSGLSAMVAHRFFWLAEDTDQWTTTGLQDPTGRSGDFLAQQIEASIEWTAVPKLLTLEAGWVRLLRGDFSRNAPNAPADKGDSNYFYAATSIKF